MAKENKIADALQVLSELGMPRAQQNNRSALCLLALRLTRTLVFSLGLLRKRRVLADTRSMSS
jgi:hypothetical protein